MAEFLCGGFDGEETGRRFGVGGAEEGDEDGETGHGAVGKPRASVRFSAIKSTKISRVM